MQGISAHVSRRILQRAVLASHSVTGLVFLRWVVVCTQAAGIVVTWPLWQVRVSPPMLPVFSGMSCGMAVPLLVSLGCVLFWPRWGTWLHLSLLLLAMLLDQMRLQPEFLSQALLLLGVSGSPHLRTMARFHLIALWFFAGFWKLTSPFYYTGDAQWLVHSLLPGSSPEWGVVFGVCVAVGEMALSLGAVCLATRRWAAMAGYGLHLGAVLLLAFGLDWDAAVWSWNLALAMASLVLIGGWQTSVRDTWACSTPATRAAVLVLLLLPCGYLFGLVETYLCHVLYSNHAPIAVIHSPANGTSRIIDTRPELKVPVPQVERLYRQYFAAVAQPGDRLEIRDPRLWFRWRGIERTTVSH